MLDEITLAKAIAKAFLEKTVLGFQADGKVTKAMEPGVRIAVEMEIEKGWHKFLPEARAVLGVMREDGKL